jgi:hypothetical protein
VREDTGDEKHDEGCVDDEDDVGEVGWDGSVIQSEVLDSRICDAYVRFTSWSISPRSKGRLMVGRIGFG